MRARLWNNEQKEAEINEEISPSNQARALATMMVCANLWNVGYPKTEATKTNMSQEIVSLIWWNALNCARLINNVILSLSPEIYK